MLQLIGGLVSPYTTGYEGGIRDVVVAKVENLDARESRGHLAGDFRQFSVGEAQVVGRRLQGHRQERALSSRTRHPRKLNSGFIRSRGRGFR